jgi:hypothetical protein
LVEIALGSNVVPVVGPPVVVVPVLVLVPEPVGVPVDVDAVLVVFFEPPCAAEPLAFVVVFVAPPPVVLALDGPCADAPPPFDVDVVALGPLVVGALPAPAPRPCAVAVVLNAAMAIADAANSENLRMLWTPSGNEVVQEWCPSGPVSEAVEIQRLDCDGASLTGRRGAQKQDRAFRTARRASRP